MTDPATDKKNENDRLSPSDPQKSDPPRFAHMEANKITDLTDYYEAHYEACRQIHQQVLRKFTGNPALEVDFLKYDPNEPGESALKKYKEYDVVSVSSMNFAHPESFSKAGKPFSIRGYNPDQEDKMALIISSAGNDGEKVGHYQENMSFSDFLRTSLVVGEQGYDPDTGEVFVKGHSSWRFPTLTAANPFDQGEKYKYYNTEPTFNIYEKDVKGLFKDWVYTEEAKRILRDKQSEWNVRKHEIENIKIDYKGQNIGGLGGIPLDVVKKLRIEMGGKESRRNIKDKLKEYKKDRSKLHRDVLQSFRNKGRKMDDNGYVEGRHGTSYSSPYLAGYVSGALYEQWERAQKGLPTLSKAEIATLVKLATIDVDKVEDVQYRSAVFNNAAGVEFSKFAGHGAFDEKLYRRLLDHSYKVLAANPTIDRSIVDIQTDGQYTGPKTNKNGGVTFTLNTDGQEVLIERILFDFRYSLPFHEDPPVTTHIVFDQNNGEREGRGIDLNAVSTGNKKVRGWGWRDGDFGEVVQDQDVWNTQFYLTSRDVEVDEAYMRVMGYPKAGFMATMIEARKSMTPEAVVEVEMSGKVDPSAQNKKPENKFKP